ncbi:MAG TPA: hypothetical protein VFN35_28620, partial [Ktedonobacteraceae bacterium]|nr:hypothetical protein [Ktedonobacteraceae bacterium]
AVSPAPAWSEDGHMLAYVSGSHIRIANAQNGKSAGQLSLQGTTINLDWSPAVAHQLVVSLKGSSQGIYLIDTTTNTSQKLDPLQASNSIQWTEIP